MDAVHYGDVIAVYARNSTKPGYLAGRGMIDRRLGIVPIDSGALSPPIQRGWLFHIVPMQRYSARQSYYMARVSLQTVDGTRQSRSSLNVNSFRPEELVKLDRLRQAAILEMRQNEAELKRVNGTPVRYGQVIQLRHQRSGKTITVQKRRAAAVEKTAMRVELLDADSESTWLTLSPFYKLRSEGEIARYGDKVVLSVTRSAGTYLHVSSKPYLDTHAYELNASGSRECFKMTPVVRFHQSSHDLICASSVFRFFHTEEERFLCSSIYNKTPYVYLRDSDKVRKSDASSPNALWELQLCTHNEQLFGHVAMSSIFRIRHIGTGRYLTVTPPELLTTESTPAQSRTSTPSPAQQQPQREVHSDGDSDVNHNNSNNSNNDDDGEVEEERDHVHTQPRGPDRGRRGLAKQEVVDTTLAMPLPSSVDSLAAATTSSDPYAASTVSHHRHLRGVHAFRTLAQTARATHLLKRGASNSSSTANVPSNSVGAASSSLQGSEATKTGLAHSSSLPSRLSSMLRPGRPVSTMSLGADFFDGASLFTTTDTVDDGTFFTFSGVTHEQQHCLPLNSYVQIRSVKLLSCLHATNKQLLTAAERLQQQAAAERERSNSRPPSAGPRRTTFTTKPSHATSPPQAQQTGPRRKLNNHDDEAAHMRAVTCSEHNTDSDYFSVVHVGDALLYDVDFLEEVRCHLQQFSTNMCNAKCIHDVGNLAYFERLSEMLAMLLDFLTLPSDASKSTSYNAASGPTARPTSTSPYATTSNTTDADSTPATPPSPAAATARHSTFVASVTLRGLLPLEEEEELQLPRLRERQKLMREHGVILALFDTIKAPFREYGGSLLQLTDVSNAQYSLIRHMCHRCYRVITAAFCNYRKNENYVAVYICDMQNQVGFDLNVEQTITQLLDNNRELLENVEDDDVKTFVDLLGHRKDPIFIRFLRSLCSANGKAVPHNQELVTKHLLAPLLRASPDSPEYAKPALLAFSVRDNQVWVRSADEEVTLAAFSHTYHQTKKMEFLEEQIRLYAEVCLDRNYLAIHLLREVLSAHVLLALMEDAALAFSLRAALTRLFLTMYIDADPHDKVNPVLMARLWASAGRNSLADLKFEQNCQCVSVEDELRGRIRRSDSQANIVVHDAAVAAKATELIMRTLTAALRDQSLTDMSEPDADQVHRPTGSFSTLTALGSPDRSQHNQSDVQSPVFLAALLDLTMHMVRFGIYTYPELRSLVKVLIKLMDVLNKGYNNTQAQARLHEEEMERLAKESGQHVGFSSGSELDLSGACLARKMVIDELLLAALVDSQMSILHIVQFLFDWRLDWRLGRLVGRYKERIMADQTTQRLRQGIQVITMQELDEIRRRIYDFLIRPDILPSTPSPQIETTIEQLAGQEELLQRYLDQIGGMSMCKKCLSTALVVELCHDVGELRQRYKQVLGKRRMGKHDAADERRLESPLFYTSEMVDTAVGLTEVDVEELMKLDDVLADVDGEGGSLLVPILLQHALYTNEELVKLSFEVLFRQFRQREEILERLKDVQLLVTSESVHAYRTVSYHLEHVRRLRERAELWLENTNAPEYAELTEHLRELTLFCVDMSSGGGPPPSQPSAAEAAAASVSTSHVTAPILGVPSGRTLPTKCYLYAHPAASENQRLLRNLNAHNEIVMVLELPLNLHDSRCVKIFTEAHDFLQLFCREEPTNQRLVYEHVDLFMSQMGGAPIGASNTILACLRDHVGLCGQLNEKVVRHFIAAIETEGRLVSCIRFLRSVVLVDDQPLKRNQIMVLRMATASKDVVPFLGDAAQAEVRTVLDTELSFDEENELYYHCNVVLLLSACSRGRYYEAELMCQSLLSIDLCCEAIFTSPELYVRHCYAMFLYDVYLDSEENSKQISMNHTLMVRLLHHFTDEYTRCVKENANWSRAERRLWQEYLCDAIARCVQAYFTQYVVGSMARDSQVWCNLCRAMGKFATQSWFVVSGNNTVELCLKTIQEKILRHDDVIASTEFSTAVMETLSMIRSEAAQHGLSHVNRRFSSRVVPFLRDTEGSADPPSPISDLEVAVGGGEEDENTENGGFSARDSTRFSSWVTRSLEDTAAALQSVCHDRIEAEFMVLVRILQHPQALLLNALNNSRHLTGCVTEVATNINQVGGSVYEQVATHEQVFSDAAYLDSLIRHTESLVRAGDSRVCVDLMVAMQDFILEETNLIEETTPVGCYFKEASRRFLCPKALSALHHHGNSIKLQRELQNELVQHGACRLVIEVVGHGRDRDVFREALVLGIALMEGGNQTAQRALYDHFVLAETEGFFQELSQRVSQAGNELQVIRQINARRHRGQQVANSRRARKESRVEQSSSANSDQGFIKDVLRFLQLLCEGHNKPMQQMLLSQRHTGHAKSYNLLLSVVRYLDAACGESSSMSSNITEKNSDVIIQCLKTITEFCQGPCRETQDCVLEYGNSENDVLCELLLNDLHLLEMTSWSTAVWVRDAAAEAVLAVMESRAAPGLATRLVQNFDIHLLLDRIQLLMDAYDRYEGGLLDNISRDEVFAAAHRMYILARTLAQFDHRIREVVLGRTPSSVSSQGYTLERLVRHTGIIEIVRDGNMERVFFPKPRIFSLYETKKREMLLRDVSRSDHRQSLELFFNRAESIKRYIDWRERLQQNEILWWFNRNSMWWRRSCFLFAVIINWIMIIFNPVVQNFSSCAASNDSDMECTVRDVVDEFRPSIFGSFQTLYMADESAHWLLQLVCVPLAPFVPHLLLLFGVGLCLFSVFSVVALVADNADAMRDAIRHPMVPYTLAFSLFSFLGLLWSPYFYPLLLFDLVIREEELQNVIRSVVRPKRALFLTAMFAGVCLYMFAVFGHVYFQEDFLVDNEYRCSTLLMCIQTMLHMGLRSGGGIGDVLVQKATSDATYHPRLYYDLLFFSVVIILLLNIVFGIIIDTFADLRSEKMEKDDRLRNVCFVCGIERSAFDRHGSGFENHIDPHVGGHSLWNYLSFTVYLKRKEDTELSGPEQYVKRLLPTAATRLKRAAAVPIDLQWVPQHQAMCLLKGADESDETEEKIEKILSGQARLLEKIEAMGRETELLRELVEDQRALLSSAGISSSSL